MTDVDPVVYERDLAACQAIAQTPYPAGAIAVGMVIGASVGAGLGTIIAPLSGAANLGLAESTGGLSGGAAGAVPGAAAGTTVQPAQSLDACLAAHGYKVLPRGS
jgi:hypothetical protein